MQLEHTWQSPGSCSRFLKEASILCCVCCCLAWSCISSPCSFACLLFRCLIKLVVLYVETLFPPLRTNVSHTLHFAWLLFGVSTEKKFHTWEAMLRLSHHSQPKTPLLPLFCQRACTALYMCVTTLRLRLLHMLCVSEGTLQAAAQAAICLI